MTMRLAQLLSLLSLAGILMPPILVVADQISLDVAKAWILGATVVWFLVTPTWMGRPRPQS